MRYCSEQELIGDAFGGDLLDDSGSAVVGVRFRIFLSQLLDAICLSRLGRGNDRAWHMPRLAVLMHGGLSRIVHSIQSRLAV